MQTCRLVVMRSNLRYLCLLVLLVVLPTFAHAQTTPKPEATAAPQLNPESWAGQLQTLSKWLEQRQEKPGCKERCFTLDRLRITGTVGQGPLTFELSGGVLADGPIAVPLFGPPAHVRVQATTDKGEPAAIGFEGDHYFFFTASRRFELRGTLSLEGDLALVIPGPLNTLDAELDRGTVVEGTRLSGLLNTTIHLSTGGDSAKSAGPTVFQLSRAVRVGREIGFEYRLVMRSGTDLGVVRLPLSFGEKVLDVTGSIGWKVEEGELVLPTSGRTAEMTVTGTLAKLGSFTPEARSPYEWWLLESDAEHRISVKGDARQVDSAESPIGRTQANSRLFLVQKGQHIEVGVQPLVSVDVLAAVVRNHSRTLVLTDRGDLVADDSLQYENNGIDYLLYTANGRPIYLATDSKAERIMHQGENTQEVLVPLKTGSHSVKVQSLSAATKSALAGAMNLPMPSYPLTASRVNLTVGLPEKVFPVALLGGDRWEGFLDDSDLVFAILGFLVGWVAVRPAPDASKRARLRLRLFGGLLLSGLWFLSHAVYAVTMLILITTAIVWLIRRLTKGIGRTALLVVLLTVGGIMGLTIVLASMTARAPSSSRTVGYSDSVPMDLPTPSSKVSLGDDRTGNYMAQLAQGGVLEGVTPVALSLPSYARSVHVSRELVTKDRPFRPVLLYVTGWVLWPLAALWLVMGIVVVSAHWTRALATYRGIAQRLASAPQKPPPPSPTILVDNLPDDEQKSKDQSVG